MATRKETRARREILTHELRREYSDGELAHGQMLPPVRALAGRFGLSKRIVNDELQKLVDEGWLHTVPRVGVFVGARVLAAPRLLEHAVVVLTGMEQPHPSHRESGWLDHVTAGALSEIHRRGLHSVVLHPDRLSGEMVQRLAAEMPYGAIIPEGEPEVMRRYAELLGTAGVRVAIVGNDLHVAGFDRVSSDHAAGTHMLTKWLLEHDIRRIAPVWLGATGDSYWRRERRRGYERAIREAGLEPLADIDLSEDGPPDSAVLDPASAKLARHLRGVAGQERYEALLAPSDGFVSDIALACEAAGLQPNEDIRICGYDNYWRDLEAQGHYAPRPCATVDKLNKQTGAAAVQLLLDRAEGKVDGAACLRMVVPSLVPLETASELLH